MSSADIAEAMAYDRIEPFGEHRADLRAGIIASTIANVNRTKKTDKEYKPVEFMPTFKPRTKAKVLAEKIREVFNIGDNSKPSN